MLLNWVLGLAFGVVLTAASNFSYENDLLADNDVQGFDAVAFGNASTGTYSGPRCRVVPGNPDWPTDAAWAKFNISLGGRLLKPHPLASACYQGPRYDQQQCEFLLGPANATRVYSDDPLTALTEWAQGNTCPATLAPVAECSQGGFPIYVVNATSVRHIQLAVNFARNNHIRLIIKNTGHDFNGRSTGFAALSIWVHNLKSFEFLPDYSIGEYRGRAAKFGAGLESWEAASIMNKTGNFTIKVAGGPTLALAGGWAQGGGHGVATSFFGLGSDQLLSLNVVTADGRFVTADPTQNQDLFFALRGGGGGTYGIVTSVVCKAYPGVIPSSGMTYSFATGPVKPGNLTSSLTWPRWPTIQDVDGEVFWKAFGIFLRYAHKAMKVGGAGFGDLNKIGNDSYTFITSFTMINMTTDQSAVFFQPLWAEYRAAGIDIPDIPIHYAPYSKLSLGTGDMPSYRFFASRLFPSENWKDDKRFENMTSAIRQVVSQGGYQVRCRNFSPSLAAAGYPGTSSAISPAFRNSLMHATVFPPEQITRQTPTDVWLGLLARLNSYMDVLRKASPGGGAYMNEADIREPDWQHSFYGSHYERLRRIKKKVDPWGLFWATTTPGSEEWEVITKDGEPSQNGPLCRRNVKSRTTSEEWRLPVHEF